MKIFFLEFLELASVAGRGQKPLVVQNNVPNYYAVAIAKLSSISVITHLRITPNPIQISKKKKKNILLQVTILVALLIEIRRLYCTEIDDYMQVILITIIITSIILFS